MKFRTSLIIILAGLITAAVISIGASHGQAAADKPDPITGDWDATFTLQGTSIPVKLNLKLDGQQVTGTVFSEHTGAGTLGQGAWMDQKLKVTLDFPKHESIALSGWLDDGKLTGEFTTEGMKGTWTATKK